MEWMVYVLLLLGGCLVGYLIKMAASAKEMTQLVAQRDVFREKAGALIRQREEEQMRHQSMIEEQKEHYRQQLEEMRRQQQETEERQARQLSQQMELLRQQVNAAAEQMLSQRSRQLASANQEQLATFLLPLNDTLKHMKEAVEKNDRLQTEAMARLDESIKENLRQAREVGERADKLAQALVNDNKVQGNFGELRLKQLLEEMGLEEGLQFEEQTTLRDEQGRALHSDEDRRMIPDVILHFPDKRDVVIDSKVSLKAFEDYYMAKTPEEKEEALKRHVNSVRSHVAELARKRYNRFLKDGSQLDFVLMYMFSEGALQLAMAHDPMLWKEAYDQNVVIAGSQSLYIMLRVLEMTWRHVRQVENQHKIMEAANTVVERTQMFYDRFLKVEEQLNKTHAAFNSLKVVTASTGQSIVTAAGKLVKYGAQESKRKPKLPTFAETDKEPVKEEYSSDSITSFTNHKQPLS